MSEPMPLPLQAGIDDFAAARRLSGKAAILAGRIATLLAMQLPPGRENSLTGGQAFLNMMFKAWTEGSSAAEIEALAGGDLAPPGLGQPLDRLVAALALTPSEVDLLLLAGLPEEHEGYASVLRTLNPKGEARASVGLAAQLLCADWQDRVALRELLHEGAAVRHGLLSLSGEAGFFEQDLILAPGLWPVLGGLDVWPKQLAPLVLDAVETGLDTWLDSLAVRRVAQALASGLACVVLVCADSEAVACLRAAALARHAGVSALAFELAPGLGHERLALLHALARGAVPIFQIHSSEQGSEASLPVFAGFPGAAIACVRRGAGAPASALPMFSLSVDPLPASARARLWQDTLPELAGQAAVLAGRYNVEPAAARQIAVDARAMAALDAHGVDLESVSESVRTRSIAMLATGVQVVRPTAQWDQLILPADRKAQLAEALQRLFHQAKVLEEWRFLEGRPGARGVRILMSGPPGTGKTLSAEVMAQALGVDLLVADISRIVSKWIGETEKNLAGIFEAAERAQAVLLFDEADALFGKRTEVSDAHDRYANLETAYLLSRIERFEGLTMLSTNLKQNIDPAFLRRLEFAIDFDEPQVAEREALWRCHLPTTAPLASDVNLHELAALYPIVGGLIRNASVAAAFLAAEAETAITRSHLICAIRREYEKSGKAFPGVPAGMSIKLA